MSLPMLKDGITLEHLMFSPDTFVSVVSNASLGVGGSRNADSVGSHASAVTRGTSQENGIGG